MKDFAIYALVAKPIIYFSKDYDEVIQYIIFQKKIISRLPLLATVQI